MSEELETYNTFREKNSDTKVMDKLKGNLLLAVTDKQEQKVQRASSATLRELVEEKEKQKEQKLLDILKKEVDKERCTKYIILGIMFSILVAIIVAAAYRIYHQVYIP